MCNCDHDMTIITGNHIVIQFNVKQQIGMYVSQKGLQKIRNKNGNKLKMDRTISRRAKIVLKHLLSLF